MGSKRNRDALAADDDGEPGSWSNKRRREQQGSSSKQAEGKPDPTYGQRAAFPGLDGDDSALLDDDLEYEEQGDALAYLRSVRQEASSVPNVLVAPKAGPQLPSHLQATPAIDRSIYDDGVGDSRGYYHDGAYTAAPDPDPSTVSSPGEAEQHGGVPLDAATEADRVAARNAALRRAYFAALSAQFLALRARLHRTPPAALVAALPADHGTHVGAFGAASPTFRVWTRRVRHTDPLPVQVAALDRQSVLRLLRVILGGKFVRRGCELRERTSRWIWALLARLPDRGEMDYAEVGWVRELGKRAVLMMVSMAQMEALQEEVDGDLEGEVVDGQDGDDEEEEEEEEEEEFGGEVTASEEEAGGKEKHVADETPPEPAANPAADGTAGLEDGEADMDIDEGEVTDDDAPGVADNKDIAADIAAAKARLLARLEEPADGQIAEPSLTDADRTRQTIHSREEGAVLDEDKARVNMRATLNMILTVAGEFYGQRDLLEFRDPFPAA